MFIQLEQYKSGFSFRFLVSFIILTFCSSLIIHPPKAHAQSVFVTPANGLNLPAPGAMVPLSPGYIPPLLHGIKVHPENPLLFDFLVDGGDAHLNEAEFKKETTKLIKYFLASLTVPKEDLWVNLSPHEQDRIIPNDFGVTEMGRDLLAQDYILKQLTSSLMYPEDDLGKAFWAKVYKTAQEKYGTTDIPINTFNKVWIVPDRAVVYENDNTAFVVESYLRVMLEEDYVSRNHLLRRSLNDTERSRSPDFQPSVETSGKVMLESDYEAMTEGVGSRVQGLESELNPKPYTLTPDPQTPNSKISSQIIREIILPAIEKEVNEGKNFAQLRQIYQSLILASWFKKAFAQSFLGQVYVDQNKVLGVDVKDKQIKQKIYEQYLEAFKKGAYNYIKEDYDPYSDQVIARKYFSGGTGFSTIGEKLETTASSPLVALRREQLHIDNIHKERVLLQEAKASEDESMVASPEVPLLQAAASPVMASGDAYELAAAIGPFVQDGQELQDVINNRLFRLKFYLKLMEQRMVDSTEHPKHPIITMLSYFNGLKGGELEKQSLPIIHTQAQQNDLLKGIDNHIKQFERISGVDVYFVGDQNTSTLGDGNQSVVVDSTQKRVYIAAGTKQLSGVLASGLYVAKRWQQVEERLVQYETIDLPYLFSVLREFQPFRRFSSSMAGKITQNLSKILTFYARRQLKTLNIYDLPTDMRAELDSVFQREAIVFLNTIIGEYTANPGDRGEGIIPAEGTRFGVYLSAAFQDFKSNYNGDLAQYLKDSTKTELEYAMEEDLFQVAEAQEAKRDALVARKTADARTPQEVARRAKARRALAARLRSRLEAQLPNLSRKVRQLYSQTSQIPEFVDNVGAPALTALTTMLILAMGYQVAADDGLTTDMGHLFEGQDQFDQNAVWSLLHEYISNNNSATVLKDLKTLGVDSRVAEALVEDIQKSKTPTDNVRRLALLTRQGTQQEDDKFVEGEGYFSFTGSGLEGQFPGYASWKLFSSAESAEPIPLEDRVEKLISQLKGDVDSYKDIQKRIKALNELRGIDSPAVRKALAKLLNKIYDKQYRLYRKWANSAEAREKVISLQRLEVMIISRFTAFMNPNDIEILVGQFDKMKDVNRDWYKILSTELILAFAGMKSTTSHQDQFVFDLYQRFGQHSFRYDFNDRENILRTIQVFAAFIPRSQDPSNRMRAYRELENYYQGFDWRFIQQASLKIAFIQNLGELGRNWFGRSDITSPELRYRDSLISKVVQYIGQHPKEVMEALEKIGNESDQPFMEFMAKNRRTAERIFTKLLESGDPASQQILERLEKYDPDFKKIITEKKAALTQASPKLKSQPAASARGRTSPKNLPTNTTSAFPSSALNPQQLPDSVEVEQSMESVPLYEKGGWFVRANKEQPKGWLTSFISSNGRAVFYLQNEQGQYLQNSNSFLSWGAQPREIPVENMGPIIQELLKNEKWLSAKWATRLHYLHRFLKVGVPIQELIPGVTSNLTNVEFSHSFTDALGNKLGSITVLFDQTNERSHAYMLIKADKKPGIIIQNEKGLYFGPKGWTPTKTILFYEDFLLKHVQAPFVIYAPQALSQTGTSFLSTMAPSRAEVSVRGALDEGILIIDYDQDGRRIQQLRNKNGQYWNGSKWQSDSYQIKESELSKNLYDALGLLPFVGDRFNAVLQLQTMGIPVGDLPTKILDDLNLTEFWTRVENMDGNGNQGFIRVVFGRDDSNPRISINVNGNYLGPNGFVYGQPPLFSLSDLKEGKTKLPGMESPSQAQQIEKTNPTTLAKGSLAYTARLSGGTLTLISTEIGQSEPIIRNEQGQYWNETQSNWQEDLHQVDPKNLSFALQRSLGVSQAAADRIQAVQSLASRGVEMGNLVEDIIKLPGSRNYRTDMSPEMWDGQLVIEIDFRPNSRVVVVRFIIGTENTMWDSTAPSGRNPDGKYYRLKKFVDGSITPPFLKSNSGHPAQPTMSSGPSVSASGSAAPSQAAPGVISQSQEELSERAVQRTQAIDGLRKVFGDNRVNTIWVRMLTNYHEERFAIFLTNEDGTQKVILNIHFFPGRNDPGIYLTNEKGDYYHSQNNPAWGQEAEYYTVADFSKGLPSSFPFQKLGDIAESQLVATQPSSPSIGSRTSSVPVQASRPAASTASLPNQQSLSSRPTIVSQPSSPSSSQPMSSVSFPASKAPVPTNAPVYNDAGSAARRSISPITVARVNEIQSWGVNTVGGMPVQRLIEWIEYNPRDERFLVPQHYSDGEFAGYLVIHFHHSGTKIYLRDKDDKFYIGIYGTSRSIPRFYSVNDLKNGRVVFPSKQELENMRAQKRNRPLNYPAAGQPPQLSGGAPQNFNNAVNNFTRKLVTPEESKELVEIAKHNLTRTSKSPRQRRGVETTNIDFRQDEHGRIIVKSSSTATDSQNQPATLRIIPEAGGSVLSNVTTSISYGEQTSDSQGNRVREIDLSGHVVLRLTSQTPYEVQVLNRKGKVLKSKQYNQSQKETPEGDSSKTNVRRVKVDGTKFSMIGSNIQGSLANTSVPGVNLSQYRVIGQRLNYTTIDVPFRTDVRTRENTVIPVLDLSSSMDRSGEVGNLKTGAIGLLDVAYVPAMVTFASHIDLRNNRIVENVPGLSLGEAQLDAAQYINSVRVGGETYGWTTLWNLYIYLSSLPQDQLPGHIIMFSDGFFNDLGSRTKIDFIEEIALFFLNNEIKFSFIGAGEIFTRFDNYRPNQIGSSLFEGTFQSFPHARESGSPEAMRKLVAVTNGKWFSTRDNVASAFKRAARSLFNAEIVAQKPPASHITFELESKVDGPNGQKERLELVVEVEVDEAGTATALQEKKQKTNNTSLTLILPKLSFLEQDFLVEVHQSYKALSNQQKDEIAQRFQQSAQQLSPFERSLILSVAQKDVEAMFNQRQSDAQNYRQFMERVMEEGLQAVLMFLDGQLIETNRQINAGGTSPYDRSSRERVLQNFNFQSVNHITGLFRDMGQNIIQAQNALTASQSIQALSDQLSGELLQQVQPALEELKSAILINGVPEANAAIKPEVEAAIVAINKILESAGLILLPQFENDGSFRLAVHERIGNSEIFPSVTIVLAKGWNENQIPRERPEEMGTQFAGRTYIFADRVLAAAQLDWQVFRSGRSIIFQRVRPFLEQQLGVSQGRTLAPDQTNESLTLRAWVEDYFYTATISVQQRLQGNPQVAAQLAVLLMSKYPEFHIQVMRSNAELIKILNKWFDKEGYEEIKDSFEKRENELFRWGLLPAYTSAYGRFFNPEMVSAALALGMDQELLIGFVKYENTTLAEGNVDISDLEEQVRQKKERVERQQAAEAETRFQATVSASQQDPDSSMDQQTTTSTFSVQVKAPSETPPLASEDGSQSRENTDKDQDDPNLVAVKDKSGNTDELELPSSKAENMDQADTHEKEVTATVQEAKRPVFSGDFARQRAQAGWGYLNNEEGQNIDVEAVQFYTYQWPGRNTTRSSPVPENQQELEGAYQTMVETYENNRQHRESIAILAAVADFPYPLVGLLHIWDIVESSQLSPIATRGARDALRRISREAGVPHRHALRAILPNMSHEDVKALLSRTYQKAQQQRVQEQKAIMDATYDVNLTNKTDLATVKAIVDGNPYHIVNGEIATPDDLWEFGLVVLLGELGARTKDLAVVVDDPGFDRANNGYDEKLNRSGAVQKVSIFQDRVYDALMQLEQQNISETEEMLPENVNEEQAVQGENETPENVGSNEAAGQVEPASPLKTETLVDNSGTIEKESKQEQSEVERSQSELLTPKPHPLDRHFAKFEKQILKELDPAQHQKFKVALYRLKLIIDQYGMPHDATPYFGKGHPVALLIALERLNDILKESDLIAFPNFRDKKGLRLIAHRITGKSQVTDSGYFMRPLKGNTTAEFEDFFALDVTFGNTIYIAEIVASRLADMYWSMMRSGSGLGGFFNSYGSHPDKMDFIKKQWPKGRKDLRPANKADLVLVINETVAIHGDEHMRGGNETNAELADLILGMYPFSEFAQTWSKGVHKANSAVSVGSVEIIKLLIRQTGARDHKDLKSNLLAMGEMEFRKLLLTVYMLHNKRAFFDTERERAALVMLSPQEVHELREHEARLLQQGRFASAAKKQNIETNVIPEPMLTAEQQVEKFVDEARRLSPFNRSLLRALVEKDFNVLIETQDDLSDSVLTEAMKMIAANDVNNRLQILAQQSEQLSAETHQKIEIGLQEQDAVKVTNSDDFSRRLDEIHDQIQAALAADAEFVIFVQKYWIRLKGKIASNQTLLEGRSPPMHQGFELPRLRASLSRQSPDVLFKDCQGGYCTPGGAPRLTATLGRIAFSESLESPEDLAARAVRRTQTIAGLRKALGNDHINRISAQILTNSGADRFSLVLTDKTGKQRIIFNLYFFPGRSDPAIYLSNEKGEYYHSRRSPPWGQEAEYYTVTNFSNGLPPSFPFKEIGNPQQSKTVSQQPITSPKSRGSVQQPLSQPSATTAVSSSQAIAEIQSRPRPANAPVYYDQSNGRKSISPVTRARVQNVLSWGDNTVGGIPVRQLIEWIEYNGTVHRFLIPQYYNDNSFAGYLVVHFIRDQGRKAVLYYRDKEDTVYVNLSRGGFDPSFPQTLTPQQATQGVFPSRNQIQSAQFAVQSGLGYPTAGSTSAYLATRPGKKFMPTSSPDQVQGVGPNEIQALGEMAKQHLRGQLPASGSVSLPAGGSTNIQFEQDEDGQVVIRATSMARIVAQQPAKLRIIPRSGGSLLSFVKATISYSLDTSGSENNDRGADIELSGGIAFRGMPKVPYDIEVVNTQGRVIVRKSFDQDVETAASNIPSDAQLQTRRVRVGHPKFVTRDDQFLAHLERMQLPGIDLSRYRVIGQRAIYSTLEVPFTADQRTKDNTAVLLIDTSESVKQDMPQLQKGAANLLDVAYVPAMGSFSTKTDFHHGLTNQDARAIVNQLYGHGNTSGYQSLWDAYQYLRTLSPDQLPGHIIMFSDGDFDEWKGFDEDTIREIAWFFLNNEIKFSFIGLGPKFWQYENAGPDRVLSPLFEGLFGPPYVVNYGQRTTSSEAMWLLRSITGGEWIPVNGGDIAGAFQKASRSLFKVEVATNKPPVRQIEIELESNEPGPDGKKKYVVLVFDVENSQTATMLNQDHLRQPLQGSESSSPVKDGEIAFGFSVSHGPSVPSTMVTGPLGTEGHVSSPIRTEASSSVADSELGGIDLTDFDIEIRRDSKGNIIPLPLHVIENFKFDGLVPVIINIVPVQSLPLFLGYADETPDSKHAQTPVQYDLQANKEEEFDNELALHYS